MREHQLRTYRGFNLHLVDAADCVGGVWPAIAPSHAVPKGMTTFLPSQADKHPDDFVHFFIDDYRFERLWNQPERYIGVLKKYAGAIMPNYSTYHIMPLPMQWWNMYRNRALAYYWQENGIEVIPLLQCGDPRTYDYAFEGLPIGGTYAVMDNGLLRDVENRAFFFEFIDIAVDAVKPDLLVAYGTEVPLNVPCDVIWYKNDNTSRVRTNYGKLLASGDEAQDAEALIDVDEQFAKRMSEVRGDRYVRAVSTVVDRNPLMYNEELPGWEPFYYRELGIALPEAGEGPTLELPPDDGLLMLDDGSVQQRLF